MRDHYTERDQAVMKEVDDFLFPKKVKVEYFPKGSMCANCQHLAEDCSELPFSSMEVINTCRMGTQAEYRFVKCTGFERYVGDD
jgi:hypothetical protein